MLQSCTFLSYSKLFINVTDCNLPHLHLVPPLGVTHSSLHQKTRVPGVACIIQCLAILIQHWRVIDTVRQTDRQTDGQTTITNTALTLHRMVK